jgi:hypothetical protein
MNDVFEKHDSIDVFAEGGIVMLNHLDSEVFVDVHAIVVIAYVWPDTANGFGCIAQDHFEPLIA